MASQQQSGRANSKARRQLQVNGKGRSVAASAPTRQPSRRERKPVPVANPTPVPAAQAAAPVTPSFATPAPASMPKPKRAEKSASRVRRESLAARGKKADRSSDRLRNSEMALKRRSAAEAKASKGNCGCGGSCCQEAEAKALATPAPVPAPSMSVSSNVASKVKRRPVVNASSTGRMLSRARRAAMAGRGKAGLEAHGKGNSSASLARQANPEISGRDLARVVRESRSKSGGNGSTLAAPTRTRRPRNAAEAKLVTGTELGHTEKLTGDEVGLCHSGVTGTSYMSSEVFDNFCQTEAPKVPAKVRSTETLSGSTVTSGGVVGRSQQVTGDEKGSCRNVTGDEYIGREQFEKFCGTNPEPASAKVSISHTTRGQVISGPSSSRSSSVTGNEAGTCKAVTGTPYTGFDQSLDFCKPNDVKAIQSRGQSPVLNTGREISGIQPGLSGLTGAEKGGCQVVSGTAYLDDSEKLEVCGTKQAEMTDSDFPQLLEGAPWGAFSVLTPKGGNISAKPQAETSVASTVTGANSDNSRVSGAFSLGGGKVTGTEQGRSDNFLDKQRTKAVSTLEQPKAEKIKLVTGEGNESGLKITGNDWDRGDHVTGTEGRSSTVRNKTIRGPMSAMPGVAVKRNEEVPPSESKVTGGSGSTEKGAMITLSGGARG